MQNVLSYWESDQYFPTPIQSFQFYDKYSRFNKELGRRETWEESVDRAVNFLRKLSENKLNDSDYVEIKEAMLNMEAFCSMRLFAMAGPAAERDHTTIYNCAYLPVDRLESFSEALSVYMAGCGVGFSVESQWVDRLPVVSKATGGRKKKIVIDDSAEGWVLALKAGVSAWMGGKDVKFDYSKIRPAGSVLKTKGGRASGPEPLKRLLDFTRNIIQGAAGRNLTSLEVHDIMTMIGDCAVSGGARRSAMISFFDQDDDEMMHSKDNGWVDTDLQRKNANNSMVVNGSLTKDEIKQAFERMDEGYGEPGLFFRYGMDAPRRERRDDFGGNPCLEIYLRPRQFCNLSQAIVRPGDNFDALLRKIRIATIIGTIQSSATHFPNLSDEWKDNCEEERLLGVDITGQMDHPGIFTPQLLTQLRQHAIKINKEYAAKLGINQSVAVTCVKPSGNSSVLFDCAPGIHSRWAPYYIRRVRINANSPMRHVLEYAGMVLKPENGQEYETANTLVAEFPIKAPENAVTNGRSALEQCEWWLMNKVYYTEHNPSVTILYRPEEVPGIARWVYEHQHLIGGMSFLPRDDHNYEQAPYEEIDAATYESMIEAFPYIDFSVLHDLETTDNTTVAQEVACAGGQCLI